MIEEDKKSVQLEYETRIMEEERKLQVLKDEELKIETEKRDKMCPDHLEKLNVYCLSCQKLTCATCKVFGDCQTCTVLKIDQAFELKKKEMQESIQKVTNSTDRVQSGINHCNELKIKLDEVTFESKNKINDQFDKIFAALEAKKQQLLSKVTGYTTETTGILCEAKTRYTTAIESSNSDVNEALMLDSKGDKIEFLRNSHRLIESLLASNIDLDLRPPNINLANSQKWKIDLTALVEVVKKIDFSSDIRFKQSVTGNKSMKRVSSQNTIPISKMNSTHIGMNHASNSDDRDPTLTFNKLMSEDSSMTMSIDGGINVSADYFKTNPPLSSSKKTNKRISINEHEDMQNVGIGTNNYRVVLD